ncbi:peptidylprolyl isomerase [Algisphaera agarilytica]|uniref:Foldase protein PrsA n=1 Tax=Algisphaera agarilytica TaxID=1385975 RepID=A0A7X0LLZ7_9BACT|nr:peptidyl-prolyl cis-trans isomerase [Algisphaera agarilytica]MBB6431429.1 foldase protein PrsA [Algisphaera agarilytica]
MAYVGGEPLRSGDLLPPMLEATGGEILSELVLDEMLQRRLDTAGITLTEADLDTERQVLLQTLSDDEDQSVRLLTEMRQRRGWGEVRFAGLLRRNAGLRALVKDQVTVPDAAVEQAYRLRYGPSSRVRLIVAGSLKDARDLRDRITTGGEPFGEVAALESTDVSKAQGGLLSPIRPEDTSYPAAMRQAIERLEVGQVSQPIAIDGGFALLKLEEKIAPAEVEFDDVRESLEQAVRGRTERVLMQQLARELLSGAELVVLDPTLKALWQAQRESLLTPQ